MKRYSKRLKRVAKLRAEIKKRWPFAHQVALRRAAYRKLHEQLYGGARITRPVGGA